MEDKALYLDCSSGIAGDMLLGTLIDLGASESALRDLADKLGVEAEIKIEKAERGAETAKKVTVIAGEGKERHLSDIKNLLDGKGLPEYVLDGSLKTFDRLAEAESKVHGVGKEEIHFHEVGAIDSIIDIVGTFVLLNDLEPDKIYSSKVNLGRGGKIDSEHGKISNPAPATVELLNGIPVYSTIQGDETVTPTGAALLKTIVDEFDSFPSMKIVRSGRGAGSKNLPIPNILRSTLGELLEDPENRSVEESITRVETNIDDCNPELIGETVEKLFEAGALDVFQVPVNMKKNRTGVELVTLCKSENLPEMEKVIFEETSTFGFRYTKMKKKELPREIKQIQTKYGDIEVKFGYFGDEKIISPEFESCKSAADKNETSLRNVYEEAKKQALVQLSNEKDIS